MRALYDGASQSSDAARALAAARAHVLAHAEPADADLRHEHGGRAGADGQAPAVAGAEQAAVIVTGTAHGDDGWSAPTAPYRLECLLLAGPVRGWLVDDLVTDPLPTPATLAPTASH
jgi:hypothetical protein